MRVSELTGGAPVVAGGTSAARRAARTWTQRPDVEIQFGDGAAEGVAVHSELACCLTLVAFVLLQNREDETFLEFANGFGIENSAFVHLENQGFQLVFHNASLYHFRYGQSPNGSVRVTVAGVGNVLGHRSQEVPPIGEALPQFPRCGPNQSATRDQHERRNSRIADPRTGGIESR